MRRRRRNRDLDATLRSEEAAAWHGLWKVSKTQRACSIRVLLRLRGDNRSWRCDTRASEARRLRASGPPGLRASALRIRHALIEAGHCAVRVRRGTSGLPRQQKPRMRRNFCHGKIQGLVCISWATRVLCCLLFLIFLPFPDPISLPICRVEQHIIVLRQPSTRSSSLSAHPP
jgi:hypothetical protein